ncbi:LLM class flavin-dependent oxidoreductase [Arthrobacter sp. LFS091]|uniref:LLM class flavin-dependent oxidoreductase n=1 Tax=Arthrobacter sp. LFS091 TaxID=3229892 RepID=UPI003A803361
MTQHTQGSKRIGFFTRLLDDAGPAERYRLALEQIQAAESEGFDAAWVAQHHFNEAEGGLPAPLIFLAYAAARTSRIRLGTGIITLPLEDDRATALRFAETGLRRIVPHFERQGHVFASHKVEDLIPATDSHVGSVEDVVESLSRDSVLERATDVTFQVHSIDPPHEHILRSIKLAATQVVPRLGWKPVPTPVPALQGEK